MCIILCESNHEGGKHSLEKFMLFTGALTLIQAGKQFFSRSGKGEDFEVMVF